MSGRAAARSPDGGHREGKRSRAVRTWLLVPVLAGFVLAVLVAAPAVAMASDPGGQFHRTAVLKRDGRKLVAGGTAPACDRGRVFIRVRVTQGRRVAKGRWERDACVGKPEPWQAVLETVGGKGLQRGRAHAHGIAKVKRHGRTVERRRFNRKIRLSARRGPVGDYPVYGGLTLDVGPGVHVDIVGGGAGPDNSNCTRDETVTSFTTQEDKERHLFQFIARNSYGCALQDSYSNFKVTLDGPGIHGSGRMFLGEYIALGYFATCSSGNNREAYFDKKYDWSGVRCDKTGAFELKITNG